METTTKTRGISSLAPKTTTTTPPPPSSGREDWWSDDATATLLQAWGHRFLRLNFGNLRQSDWRQVADAVNSSHCSGRPKTDTQCKNRIDTLKKKYKAEKAKLTPSSWRFFDHLDVLIGPVVKKPEGGGVVKSGALEPCRESSLEDEEEEEEEDVSEEWACKEVARAIVKLGEVYERVECRKQRMMVELEKERMEVVKEVELRRMNMLMEMQLELEKRKTSDKKV